ncbi:tRNA pseudouridine(13) synthase TruD [Limnoglobus roseus]|uniref:tRNA pseudouridine synthase D n=2 Tax=Limnoglobus roseus TaxID=2598579 RepID=A0A5C1A6Q1_9BACT|nr:tRNA pseudouridine(13) synthase TruD [Limnoglobus roseus]
MLTPDLPGVGGRIKAELDDFAVEEIPAYEPSGTGDHVYLWVEKRDLSAEFFVRGLARRLGIPADDIGTAGLKDRHAVTRQWVSIPKIAEPRLNQIDGDGVKVLTVSRHTNKLKPGHLRGNRFNIVIRDADATQPERVQLILDRVRELGLPNYYGPQRFGRDGETADNGFRMIRGERLNAPPFRLKLYLSAAQSLLFNDCLARRLTDGLFRTVLTGDVMMKWPFGGIFNADDVAVEQERFDRRETVTAGPMFGKKTFAAKGVAAEREAAVLAANDLTPANLDRPGKWMSGTRRHNLVYVEDLSAAWDGPNLRLTFGLPAGSYATVLLREVMKADADAGEE